MRSRTWFPLPVLLVATLLTTANAQQDPIGWHSTLQTARRLAAQTNRPVLIHFWADWCGACRMMDREVFSRPEVVQAIQNQFVPVKIHADHFPETARQYGVSELPTDVILTPQGQPVGRISRLSQAADAGRYVAQLNQFAGRLRPDQSPRYGGASPNGPGVAPGWTPPLATARPKTSPSPGFAVDRQAGPWQTTPPAPSGGFRREAAPTYPLYAGQVAGDTGTRDPRPGLATGPSAPTNSAAPPSDGPPVALLNQLPSGSPPLGLDGCCPVTLHTQRRWVLGDPRWGARHEGRTYLFAGPAEQQAFLADPDRYAPVFSGQDLVLAVDENRMVPGQRRFGVWYPDPQSGRVFLFSNEDTLLKFHSPAVRRYLDGLEQITGKPFRLRGGHAAEAGTAARPFRPGSSFR